MYGLAAVTSKARSRLLFRRISGKVFCSHKVDHFFCTGLTVHAWMITVERQEREGDADRRG